MEEIVAYDLDVSRTKACWFPFKKAYERSFIQSEFEDKAKVYVLEGNDDPFSKSFELSLGNNLNNRSQSIQSMHSDANSSHTTGDLPFNRSELYDTETNSTITEEDDMLSGEHAIPQLAEMHPNCMTKEFWVEDLLDRRSLACTDEFISAGRSVTRLGRSFSTFGSQTTRQGVTGNKSEHADELSFSRAETPMTPPRIEIEYDFSREIPPSEPEIHPRSIKRVMCGAIKAKDRTRPHRATLTAMSSVSNSTFSFLPKKGPSHSPSSGSAKSQSLNQGNALNSETKERTSVSESTLQMRATGEADFDDVKFPKNRILCAPIQSRRQRNAPADIGDIPSDEEKKTEEAILVVPTQSVPETSLPAKILDPPGALCIRNPHFDAPWVSNVTNKLRAKTCAVTKFDWEENRTASVDDSEETHYYVEVEASAQQLNTVKDLDEIKNQEAARKIKTPRNVESARVTSLVDDDSAFMERERLVDVLKRYAPKLPYSTKNESPDQTRLKEAKAPVAKPLIAPSFTPPMRMRQVRTSVSQATGNTKEQSFGNVDHNRKSVASNAGPLSSFHQVNAILSQGQHHVPGYREGKENFEDHWSHRNMSDSAFLETSDANEAPIEQTLVYSRSSASAADRRLASGARGTPSGTSWSSRVPEPSRSYDSRRTTSSSGSGHFEPSSRISVTEYPSESTMETPDVESVKVTDKGGVGDYAHDFEIARFPSLSSSAWQNAGRQQVEATKQPSEVRSFRAERVSQGRHNLEETFNSQNESNYDLMKHQSSKRISSRGDCATFNRHDNNQSLRRSYDEAVPYAVVFDDSSDADSVDYVDHREMRRRAPRSNVVVEKPIKTTSKGPAKIWIDDDESELNTEAFQKLSMDSDDDSIFNGLVDRSPTSPAEKGPPRVIEPRKGSEEIEEDSFSSGNSIEKSRRPTRNASYPTQSSGRFPRVSTGVSVVSRDEITAYTAAQSVLEEPFNCMDSWLD